MPFMNRPFLLLSAALLAFAAQTIAASERLVLYTVNYPLQYFAERIAGEHAQVVFPAPADVDPAFWMPDADTVRAYQEADLILLNGAGYAKWTAKVSLPRFKLVDTSRAFRDRYIHTEGPATHSHGPDGDHSHAGIAFTTWLDFTQAAQQAKAITEALVRKRPELRSELERRVAELEEDLMALENRLRAIVAGKPGQPLVASHPVYQYLARRYGLNLQSLMWEPEEIPGADQWHGLEQRLRDHPALWMLWEDNPNPVSVQRLDTLGVGSLVFAPAGNRPAEGDFMTLMRRNLDNLEQAFR